MIDNTRHTIEATGQVAEFVAIQLKESFAALFAAWRKTVEQPADIEGVHQLRVHSRRARAALELFQGFLPARRSKRILRQLDDLRKLAGPVRDSDVFLQRLEAKIQDVESATPVADFLHQRRSDAQRAVVEHYRSCDCGEALEDEVAEMLTQLGPRGNRNKRLNAQVSKWGGRQLRVAADRFFAKATVDPHDLESLHALRIRTKQLRYMFDLLKPVIPADRFRKATRGFKKMAQRLGEINDHATAMELVEQLADQKFQDDTTTLLRRWHKAERQALRSAVSDFEDWWKPRRQRRMQRRLKRAARTCPPLELAASETPDPVAT